MPISPGRLIAEGMLRESTPVQDYTKEYGLWVKREDLACPPPGPPFSKTRGVYAHIKSRSEDIIGVLDTYHSQAGHAVARACQVLGKECLNYYPEFKHEPGPRPPQLRAAELGATLIGIQAGRSAILFHQARKRTELAGGYMMPNALKLEESVSETEKECTFPGPDLVIIPASSGTIAAGVIRGFGEAPSYIVHMGYSRSQIKVRDYLTQRGARGDIFIVDEGYAYKDQARAGGIPSWPCNPYYDLKALRWWMREGRAKWGKDYTRVLFWNIG